MDFETEVLKASEVQPVLVDFWAPWCEPCLMLEPILTDLEAENKGEWALVKINIDEETEIANSSRIMSVPTIKVFKNQEIIATYNGLMWKPEMKKWIDNTLNGTGEQIE